MSLEIEVHYALMGPCEMDFRWFSPSPGCQHLAEHVIELEDIFCVILPCDRCESKPQSFVILEP